MVFSRSGPIPSSGYVFVFCSQIEMYIFPISIVDSNMLLLLFQAYRNFGSRVKNLKRRLDDLIPSLKEISPIPSPDINAPSPSPDSDIELPGENDNTGWVFWQIFLLLVYISGQRNTYKPPYCLCACEQVSYTLNVVFEVSLHF